MGTSRLRALVAVVACLAAIAPGVAGGQAGQLDPTFSGDGKVLTNSTGGQDYAGDVAVQADGKIVAAGAVGGSGGRIALIRYNADGTLDPSFGAGGKVFTNLSPGQDWLGAVELQPDGKIVVAGRSGALGGSFAVVRFNADGSLDSTFSSDGKATANFSTGDDFAYGLSLQSDGMVVVVGRAARMGGRLAVARFTADGIPDAGFSGDGRRTLNLTAGDDRLDHVVVQADGGIVAAGTANYFSRQARFAVIRLTNAGSVDTTFSGDGLATVNFTSQFDGAFGVELQADGKIVASGEAGPSIGLARFTVDGTLDSTFSGDGKVTTNLTPGLDYAEEIEIQADGRIVVAGGANFYGRNSRFAVVRYETSGALDPSFSGDGKVMTDMAPGFDSAYGLALQPGDGKIVAAGYASGQGGRFALARYLGA